MKNSKKLVAMALTAVCLLGIFGFSPIMPMNEKELVYFW